MNGYPLTLDTSLNAGSPRASLILVDDDDAVRRGLQLLLQGQGFDVQAFASPQAALADPAVLNARFLVVDYVLSESDGIETLKAMHARGWNGVAILISAFASSGMRSRAHAAGFAAVLDKPFRDSDLLRLLQR